ncbi:MAG TPA: cell division protein ZipA C-terminal FtsZ-binding domain-containing protein [Gammaproteobacteria bacterium]|nr:cell division protein ZipA C-terminal FtsZ-binding domain-containing protein [Gammaproteobacteria bacterium]
MAELRWVLLALGVLVVAGVYLWSRGFFRRSNARRMERRTREEPHISLEADLLSKPSRFADDVHRPAAEEVDGEDEAAAGSEPARQANAPSAKKAPPSLAPQKIVTLRFVPKNHMLDGRDAVRALGEAGLEHGRYDIFHKYRNGDPDDVLFSVASLTEPGTFDLDNLKVIAGMSFFVALPSAGDPVECYDAMVETARSLAHALDADLFDDRGSSWSIQRERYLREELIRYRHQYYSN